MTLKATLNARDHWVILRTLTYSQCTFRKRRQGEPDISLPMIPTSRGIDIPLPYLIASETFESAVRVDLLVLVYVYSSLFLGWNF